MRKLKYILIPLLILVLLLSSSCTLLNPRANKAPATTPATKAPTISERVAMLEALVTDLNLTIANLNTQILDLQTQYDNLKNISDGVLTNK